MANIESTRPGSFTWIELAAGDQHAAKPFYTSLFGWTIEDSPMGPNEYYTMFQLEGRNVGAAYTLREEQKAMHVPPHWDLYIATASADDTAKRATELGGKVLAGPFDVMTHGRMAVIQDPTGAVFCAWEAKTHHGIAIRDQHSSFCWADLNTPHQAEAAKFYCDLFGWTTTPGDTGYLHIKNGDDFIGGIPSAEQLNPHAPPHWLIYIQVDDCQLATTKAKELGASIYFGPVTMETVGTFTVLADPQGAVSALFQPAPRG